MYVPGLWRVAINRIRGSACWAYKSWRGEVDARFMTSLKYAEKMDSDRLKELQWEKLKALIFHAYKSVPFYRKQMSDLGAYPADIRTPEDFKKVPILTKRELRARQQDLISTEYSINSLHESWSGGSTGEPVKFYLDQRRTRLSTTDEIWANGWSGWKIGEPVAILWGRTEVAQRIPWGKRMVRKYLLDPGFITVAYDLNRENFLSFIEKYRRWSPTLVVGYASALRKLSEFILSENLKLLPPKAVISSAEIFDEDSRVLIEKAFGCSVMDRYGSRETGLIACQCLKGRLYHVNMQRIYLELITDDGKEAVPNEPARVIVTDLGNYGMPFLRYEIGDVARWSSKCECECGRQSAFLSVIQGRSVDFLVACDGRKIHGLYFSPLISKVPGVSQYRLVQESQGLIRLQVVEEKPISDEQIHRIVASIREMIGSNVVVEFERVDSFPKTHSGKHRYIVCNIGEND